MNAVNRILALLLFLILLALSIGALGITTGFLTVHTVDRTYSYAPLHQALTDVQTPTPPVARLTKVAIAGGVALLSLGFLLLEIRSGGRRLLQLREDEGGQVTIAFDTVRRIAEQASMDVTAVNAARCAVGRRKRSLQVRCRAKTDPFVDPERVRGDVDRAIRRRVEPTLGRPLERVVVSVERQKPGTRMRVR